MHLWKSDTEAARHERRASTLSKTIPCLHLSLRVFLILSHSLLEEGRQSREPMSTFGVTVIDSFVGMCAARGEEGSIGVHVASGKTSSPTNIDIGFMLALGSDNNMDRWMM